MMLRNDNNGRINDRDDGKRTSIESVLTFASLQIESIFDGEDLVDVFQPDPNTSMTPVLGSRSSGSSADDVDRESFKDSMIISKAPTEEETSLSSSMSNLSTKNVLENDDDDDKNRYDEEEEEEEEEGGKRIECIEQTQPYDIICGRNSGAHNCVGNRRFRITIMMNLKRYMDAPSREDKSHVIKSVIELLLDTEEVGARFLKKVGEGMYIKLEDKQIREKVGHAFRDMISLSEKEVKKREANPHFRSRWCR